MPLDKNNELVNYILNENNVSTKVDEFDDDAVDMTNDVIDDLLSVDVNDASDNVVCRQRRYRRQCPDFFDVVTPDYDVVDGGFIKNLRESINVTKKVFATILGVKEESIDDWENDIKRPNNCALRLLYLLNNHIKLTSDLFAIQMKKNQ